MEVIVKKVILVNINRNPSAEELKQIERCLSIGTATVREFPAIGDQFSVEESPTMVFTCTRVDLSGARKLFPSIVDGHDAVIYSEIHSHKQY